MTTINANGDRPKFKPDRTGPHVPLLIVAVCGVVAIIGLVVAVVWGIVRLWGWMQS